MITDIIEFREYVKDKSKNINLDVFPIKDIEIADGIFYNGKKFSAKAVGKIAEHFKLQKTFFKLIGPQISNWDMFKDALKSVNGSKIVYAIGTTKIRDILIGDEKLIPMDHTSLSKNLDIIQNTMLLHKNLRFNKGTFNDQTFEVNMKFVDERSNLTVLENDTWKTGIDISMGALNFDVRPFFQRLVCMNGNSAFEFGEGTKITNKKFDENYMFSTINKQLNKRKEMDEMIINKVVRLNCNNVSLKEFYDGKELFENTKENYKDIGSTDIHDQLILEYFRDEEILNAYNLENIKGKSDRWLATADSGINAYKFYNNLTWLSTHTDKTYMSESDCFQIQKYASDLLFKKSLDLEDIAPRVIF